MKSVRANGSPPRRRGFTLIELLAVLVIIGLFMALVLPNIGATHSSQLRQEALDLAGRLELARQRALVTGAPHRVWIDLERSLYRVEWFVDEARAWAGEEGDEEAAPAATSAPDDLEGPLSLSPPRGAERLYYPIPGRFGVTARLQPDTYFVGIDTPEGWLESGEVQVVFAVDGSSDFSELVVADAWDNKITLEVQPLLDQVRIRSDSAP